MVEALSGKGKDVEAVAPSDKGKAAGKGIDPVLRDIHDPSVPEWIKEGHAVLMDAFGKKGKGKEQLAAEGAGKGKLENAVPVAPPLEVPAGSAVAEEDLNKPKSPTKAPLPNQAPMQPSSESSFKGHYKPVPNQKANPAQTQTRWRGASAAAAPPQGDGDRHKRLPSLSPPRTPRVAQSQVSLSRMAAPNQSVPPPKPAETGSSTEVSGPKQQSSTDPPAVSAPTTTTKEIDSAAELPTKEIAAPAELPTAPIPPISATALEEFRRWTIRASFAARLARHCAEQCFGQYANIIAGLAPSTQPLSRTFQQIALEMHEEFNQYFPNEPLATEQFGAELLAETTILLERFLVQHQLASFPPEERAEPQDVPATAAATAGAATLPVPIPPTPQTPVQQVPPTKLSATAPQSTHVPKSAVLGSPMQAPKPAAGSQQQASTGSTLQQSSEPKFGLNKIPQGFTP